MKLSNRQKHLLRLHGFSAVYAIGPASSISFATEDQAEALEEFLMRPLARHNNPPSVEEFLTFVHPCRFGYTANPADNIAGVADGWAFQWGFQLLARVWFEGKTHAERVIKHMHYVLPEMRKSWVDITSYPGRELMDQNIIWQGHDVGVVGMDDLTMLERLEELEFEIVRKETEWTE